MAEIDVEIDVEDGYPIREQKHHVFSQCETFTCCQPCYSVIVLITCGIISIASSRYGLTHLQTLVYPL